MSTMSMDIMINIYARPDLHFDSGGYLRRGAAGSKANNFTLISLICGGSAL
jgi:hypothetical protein